VATLLPFPLVGWGGEWEEKGKTRWLGQGQFNRKAKEANSDNNNTGKNIQKTEGTTWRNSLSPPDAQRAPEG